MTQTTETQIQRSIARLEPICLYFWYPERFTHRWQITIAIIDTRTDVNQRDGQKRFYRIKKLHCRFYDQSRFVDSTSRNRFIDVSSRILV